MDANFSYNIVTEGSGSTYSDNIGAGIWPSNFVTNYCNVFVGVTNPVAELKFPRAGNLTLQLNKKLNWVQRVCYTILGFKYRTL